MSRHMPKISDGRVHTSGTIDNPLLSYMKKFSSDVLHGISEGKSMVAIY